MATTLARSFAEPAVTGGAPGALIRRQSKAQSFTLSTNGDIIKFFQLPVNAKIAGGGFFCAQLDSNGAPTLTLEFSVTDGTTTKKLIDAVTTGAAGSYDAVTLASGPSLTAFEVAFSTWMGFVVPTKNYYLQVKATANAATAVAGNIQVFIEYTMDLEGGEAV